MSEIEIDKATRWECQKCGQCCTGPIISNQSDLSIEKDGKKICRFFDLDKKLCLNYNERPFICRIYPFIINLDNIVKNKKAKPQKAFQLENMKIHSGCPGYKKGKRIYKNRSLERKLNRLSLYFALKFKQAFEKKQDVYKII